MVFVHMYAYMCMPKQYECLYTQVEVREGHWVSFITPDLYLETRSLPEPESRLGNN